MKETYFNKQTLSITIGRFGLSSARLVKGPLLCVTQDYMNSVDGSLGGTFVGTNGQQIKSNPSLGLFSVRDRSAIPQLKTSPRSESGFSVNSETARVPPAPSSHRIPTLDGFDEQVRQINVARNIASSTKSSAAQARESPRDHASHASAGSNGEKTAHAADSKSGHNKSGHLASGDNLKAVKGHPKNSHGDTIHSIGQTRDKSTAADDHGEQSTSWNSDRKPSTSGDATQQVTEHAGETEREHANHATSSELQVKDHSGETAAAHANHSLSQQRDLTENEALVGYSPNQVREKHSCS